jgi:glutaconate CoA-transferase subunit B
LGAAQIDRFANINSTVIGDYARPKIRLPGAGGAPEIASGAKEVCIVLSQSKRTCVNKVDFVTSAGVVANTAEDYERTGRRFRHRSVITDLCVMESDKETGELVLTSTHPGISIDRVRAETGWELRIAETVQETPVPTVNELSALRDLNMRTAAAHGGPSDN